jgi:DNA-binding LacI/PurR family transcriptional regulator
MDRVEAGSKLTSSFELGGSPCCERDRVPALTTLRVPRYAIGERAGAMICDRLAGRSVKQRIVDTGFELIARDSA